MKKEAWPNKQFLTVRVESVASKIVFSDVENADRVFLWERPRRNKNSMRIEPNQVVTLLANMSELDSSGDKDYYSLKRVQVLK